MALDFRQVPRLIVTLPSTAQGVVASAAEPRSGANAATLARLNILWSITNFSQVRAAAAGGVGVGSRACAKILRNFLGPKGCFPPMLNFDKVLT
jgi:hypothetical protein